MPEANDPWACWNVTLFYLDRYYEVETVARTEGLALTFARRSIAADLGVGMSNIAHIKTERID